MLIVIDAVLNAAQVAELQSLLPALDYEDGRSTAGWAAGLVKQNEQAAPDPAVDLWRDTIAAALAAHPLFRIAAQPKRIIGPMFSRYGIGDRYGAHVDEAILDGSRSDLAFTLFLSDPDSYDGGELVIDSPAGSDHHKHRPGSLVLYPAMSLHSVTPVTAGQRFAAVGWVRSLVRDPTQRELLFDLETARQSLFRQAGKTPEFDRLSKCYVNLLRMWAED